ncbi:alpha-defensin 1-like [Pteropus medius]|uniref:alpha-defensin 1-like n=1 Tax=Pteropus vampyrus TaxID=132908 RepID=UPI00196A96AC|nr:alpha-defensin 1-like [Pteropus giganteus]
MRTLALIATLLLLALQAQAEPLQDMADQIPAQDQPEAKDQDQPGAEGQDQPGAEGQDLPGAEGQDLPGAEGQDLPGAEGQAQPGAEGQDMAISFAGDKAHLAQYASGFRKGHICYCRRLLCRLSERRSGTCHFNGHKYRFCCS